MNLKASLKNNFLDKNIEKDLLLFLENIVMKDSKILEENKLLKKMDNNLFSTDDNNEEISEISPCGNYAKMNEIVGEGSSKIVYKALHIKNMTEVAYNMMDISHIKREDKIRIYNEIQILKKLNHPNIINIIDVWYNKEKKQVVFTVPLFSYNLKKFIEKYYLHISTEHKIKWVKQLINGISYLHSQDIIHRDLKLTNLFIDSKTGNIYIGDFGLSKKFNSEIKANSCIGTPEYMAPELYSGEYDKSVDIYALGMCILSIFSNEEPYLECHNIMQIYKKVINKIPPQTLDKIENLKIKDIILKLIGDKDMRPKIYEIKKYFDNF